MKPPEVYDKIPEIMFGSFEAQGNEGWTCVKNS